MLSVSTSPTIFLSFFLYDLSYKIHRIYDQQIYKHYTTLLYTFQNIHYLAQHAGISFLWCVLSLLLLTFLRNKPLCDQGGVQDFLNTTVILCVIGRDDLRLSHLLNEPNYIFCVNALSIHDINKISCDFMRSQLEVRRTKS